MKIQGFNLISDVIGNIDFWGILIVLLSYSVAKLKYSGPKALARALATGYYYNFIYLLGAKLKKGEFVLPTDEGLGKAKLGNDDVKLVLYLPKKLEHTLWDKAVSSAASGKKPVTVLLEGDEQRTVTYVVEWHGNNPTVLIKDFPRTYYSIKFFEDYRRRAWYLPKRKEVGASTLNAFKERLLDLVREDELFDHRKTDKTFNEKIVWQEVE